MPELAPHIAPPPPPQDVAPNILPTLRAAYSDRTAALIAFLSEFAYAPAPLDRPADHIGPPPPAAGSAVPPQLSALGFTSIFYFHNAMTDGWAYLAEGPDLAVLSFRGTKSLKNWKTNLYAALIHPGETDKRLRVHEGFYKAFEKLENDAHSLEHRFKALLSDGSHTPVYITGHSLGGALAQIAAAKFGCDRIAACYTFGSPRLGNKYLDLWVKTPSYRLVNYADIVPQVPLGMGYKHSGDVRYIPKILKQTPYRFPPSLGYYVGYALGGLGEFLKTRSCLGIEDHSIQLYFSKLDHIARARHHQRKPPP